MDVSKSRSIFKLVLSKIPIFLFCVLFITVYSGFFGKDNSIVGVVVLTGLLIFMKGDLGYDLNHAVLCFPILFAIMAVAPKLSLLNPYLGILINWISITVILILSSHDLSRDNHVTFLMGYIFCQGYDVSGKSFVLRVVSLLIGSVLIAGIYYLLHRKSFYKRTMCDLFHEMDLRSTRTQWYLKMSITLTLVMFLGDILHYPRTLWISLSVLSVMQPMPVEHRKRGIHRLPATVIGVTVFFIVFEYLVPPQYQQIAAVVSGFLAMFANSYFTKTIFNSFNALVPATLLFSSGEAVLLRIASNLLGVLIAVVADWLFSRLFHKLAKQDYIHTST